MSRNQYGFTLVEVLLLVLIVVFIVVLSINIPSSLGLVGDSQYNSLAKEIISQKIEDIRAQSYDNLANGVTSPWDDRLNNLPFSSITQTVADCPTNICTHSEKIKEVGVQINWSEGKSQKNLQIVTFIGKGGLQ